ncbi:MAG TPA: hypothetical protein VH413_01335 [Verrucomicrobiae bacterium]|jgi:hypothetical protein|nr:hypothetical protein [Verrucomicrobiae bacterium]
MNHETLLPVETTAVTKPQKRSRFRAARFAFVVIIIATISISFFTVRKRPAQQIVWLTGPEFHQAYDGGWRRIEGKLPLWILRLWSRFTPKQPGISVKASLFTLSSPIELLDLGAAITTNANGTRAWILSSAQAKTLIDRVERTDHVDGMEHLEIITAAGSSAQIQSVTTSNFGGKPVSIGPIISICPRVSGKDINLLTEVYISGWSLPPSNTAPAPELKFDAACRAIVPKGGALVLLGGTDKDIKDGTHLCILSSQLKK